MRRLTILTAVTGITFAGAMADDGLEATTDASVSAGETSASPSPGKIEAGIYLGGFINNNAGQFYDPDLEQTRGIQMLQLDRLAPEFGGRFAFFPHHNVGVEAEGSVVMASTKISGDGVQIYGLGLQALLQMPGRITPFLGLGFSVRHTSSDELGSDTDVPIHVGVGARFWVSNAVAIRFDARYLRGPSYPHPASDPNWTLNAGYGEISLGVSFNPQPRAVEVAAVVVSDPDPDKDGVLDPSDRCPTENGGTNPDGCPTRDKDGDSVVDADDMCVDQAETVNGFQDTDGCPDTIPDTDADGFDDLVDKCKDQAEDKDAFEDEDGCPDPDNDGDGVLDAKDKCPGTTGPVENAGCPDTDGDGDTVVDRLDNCPEEKGTVKNQGCKAKQLVVITKDQLKILDSVKFVTGSTKLSPASNKLLDNIARVLLSHLEIWKVKVEGHTDDVGDDAKNMLLSQGRAQSVVNYRVKKGVAPERLEGVGHGETKPVEDNATKKGKAQNRRVEFNIINE